MTMTTRTFASRARMGLALAASFALAGCLSFGKDPPEQLISLTAQETPPAGQTTNGERAQAIVVLDPDTDRRLDVLRVPVQISDSSVAYLKDASWVEKPSRAFRRLLAETIRAQSNRVVIEGSDYEVTGGTTVSGRLLDMGYDAPSQSVVVRYDAMVQVGNGPVRSRRFESRVPGIAAEALAVGPALNTAANDVAQQVARWVVGG